MFFALARRNEKGWGLFFRPSSVGREGCADNLIFNKLRLSCPGCAVVLGNGGIAVAGRAGLGGSPMSVKMSEGELRTA